jgi:hypothetical protein
MTGRDRHGLAAAALSVAKLPYAHARDGISPTATVARRIRGDQRIQSTELIAQAAKYTVVRSISVSRLRPWHVGRGEGAHPLLADPDRAVRSS